jgi:hypothetical protein
MNCAISNTSVGERILQIYSIRLIGPAFPRVKFSALLRICKGIASDNCRGDEKCVAIAGVNRPEDAREIDV